ncbi:hypothetical protein F4801DRAFT_295466 [Xylaria longipes]|nr:hypothetical protein F4801DRAFT_295466 [Xylaria longipes]
MLPCFVSTSAAAAPCIACITVPCLMYVGRYSTLNIWIGGIRVRVGGATPPESFQLSLPKTWRGALYACTTPHKKHTSDGNRIRFWKVKWHSQRNNHQLRRYNEGSSFNSRGTFCHMCACMNSSNAELLYFSLRW